MDQLPEWLAVPAIAVLSLSALYQCYILPGYLKDRAEHSAHHDAK